MKNISYRNLDFDIIQSLSWSREALFDPSHTTYECTKWLGNVLVMYNPAAASFRTRANPSETPDEAAGQMPADTDVAIRRFLEQPRGRLIVRSADDRIVLDSPGSSAPCDVRNGPFVRVNSITKIPGERLFQIHLEFETYINETPKPASATYKPLILSNRWYAIDDTNWQHLRTRIYQGVCTVRSDVLNGSDVPSAYADYFRYQFASFSVPVGFQRQRIHVSVTPDGLTAHYTVVDVEQLLNKHRNCPAVRIEVADVCNSTLTRFNSLLVQGFGFGQSLVDALIGGTINRPMNNKPEALANAAAALSKNVKTILVRAWGNQQTSRPTLVGYAMAVAQARMGRPAVFDANLSELQVYSDTTKFTEVKYTINWGFDAPQGFLSAALQGAALIGDQVLFGGAVVGAGQRAFATSIYQPEDTNDVIGFGLPGRLTTKERQVNPLFPGDSATRGTSATGVGRPRVYWLVTQALESFDTSPALPSALPV